MKLEQITEKAWDYAVTNTTQVIDDATCIDDMSQFVQSLTGKTLALNAYAYICIDSPFGNERSMTFVVCDPKLAQPGEAGDHMVLAFDESACESDYIGQSNLDSLFGYLDSFPNINHYFKDARVD